MYVKGVSIRSNIDYFKLHYPEYYLDFLNELQPDVREVYEGNVDIEKWYEIKKYYTPPIEIFAKVAGIPNPIELAKDIGRYSADVTLTGIYKFFLLVTSPHYLMKKSSNMMKTFYKDADAKVIEKGKYWFRLRISSFEDMSEILEHRILSFSQRALELANCKNVSYTIEKSMTKGFDETIAFFEWE